MPSVSMRLSLASVTVPPAETAIRLPDWIRPLWVRVPLVVSATRSPAPMVPSAVMLGPVTLTLLSERMRLPAASATARAAVRLKAPVLVKVPVPRRLTSAPVPRSPRVVRLSVPRLVSVPAAIVPATFAKAELLAILPSAAIRPLWPTNRPPARVRPILRPAAIVPSRVRLLKPPSKLPVAKLKSRPA